MNFSCDDTIAALASAAGPAARGIIRVSGVGTRASLGRLFEAEDASNWRQARSAGRHAGRLRLSKSTVPLDAAVYLWPNHRSYTGQPMAELHMPGAPPLLEAVLADLYTDGVRPARPGEFTLRAFLAGRIDLIQAEAVLGVVDAHDHRELKTALEQLAGGISGQLAGVRADLLNLLADLEAGLDFVDENIQFVTRDETAARIAQAEGSLQGLLEQASQRMQSTGRLRVVLAGLPNAGKSTLFNALAGREAALVSQWKGTTRDYLSAPLEWDRVSVELVDTAGWEPAAGPIAVAAQDLRDEQVSRADLVIWCRANDLDAEDRAADAALCDALRRDKRGLLVVATRCDLEASASTPADVNASARTGAGLAELVATASNRLTARAAGNRQFVGTTAARCRESLAGAIAALCDARKSAAAAAGDEIVALDVREALAHLGSILGAVYTDDILDRIFSRFCIGK